ncbi:hypothetical protein RDI58_029159 [Solanum bulbocastanum]|uniref:Uncharacterized protein n=1 Tax=Solanum bulbocastanum TaxID=147425 RepID=A0AAN8XZC1_SOLBU
MDEGYFCINSNSVGIKDIKDINLKQATMGARVHRYVDCLTDHLIKYCKVASLSNDVDISRIQAYAQTTEDLNNRICTRKDREQRKRAHTMGPYKEPHSAFRPLFHRYPPRPASSISPQVHGPRFDRYSQSRPGHSSSQPESHRQDHFVQIRHPTPLCTQCGKPHTGNVDRVQLYVIIMGRQDILLVCARG